MFRERSVACEIPVPGRDAGIEIKDPDGTEIRLRGAAANQTVIAYRGEYLRLQVLEEFSTI
jgi:hypothetical protein